MLEVYEQTELAQLLACDKPEGISTEGYFPYSLEATESLITRGLLEKVRSEIRGGWRVFTWYRTTEAGRQHYEANSAPVGEW